MNDLETHINDLYQKGGFTRRFAALFIKQMDNEHKNEYFNKEEIQWAHSKGFLLASAKAYGLNETNYHTYLSDYDYYRLWPLNSPYRIWINDKLTLKYTLPADRFGKFLPEYYFYVNYNLLMYLLDCDQSKFKNDISGLMALLREKKSLAMKLVNGAGSNEFYKLSFDHGKVKVNGKRMRDEDEFSEFVFSKNHHIITEYLVPHKSLYRIHDKIHTIRLMVINQSGNDPIIVHGYFRFGTNAHGESNHINKNDCQSDYDFLVQIDVESGKYWNGKKVNYYKIENCPNHPDTHVLVEGYISGWDFIKKKIIAISKYLFAVEYLGFDIGITEDGFKVIEINSHQGIKYLQLFESIYKNDSANSYFQTKIDQLDNMNEMERKARFLIAK
jgi:hypothetical protein